jgi:hypothetical protein
MVLTDVALAPATPAPAPKPKVAYEGKGCKGHRHTRVFNRRGIRKALMVSRRPRHWIRCARSRHSTRKLRVYARRYRPIARYRRALTAVTPYQCGSHGRYAIPCGIVACESGFRWSAANPSGAIGVYQLLGKGAPWPANTRARRLIHHRIAFNLYAGGRGRSHWVCRG